MYKVKKYGEKWLLYKLSLLEDVEYSIKIFNDYKSAVAECEELNKGLVRK